MYFIAYAMQLLTLICALGGSALALLQLWQQRGDALALIEKVHWAITGALSLAAALLLHALFWNDFSLVYVASYTDRVLPAFYRLTAFWAGQPGSMLFWAFSVAISGSIFALTPAYKRLTPATRLWYWGFFYAIMAFFALILSCWSNPFEMQSPVPPDGNGLNPLLQNPGMIFHPPLLFLGYGGFTVPACLALAQSLSGGEGEDGWHRVTRPVTLLAWAFLTAGIILGMWWAYMELGWGGYWAWDPVENASLIPWLISTAALHTLIVQERRNKLHRVNVALMCLTTISAFFATYLVRSGVVQSVHAFGDGSVGTPLTVFVLGGLLISFWAAFSVPARGRELAGIVSREGFLVMVCWLLLALSVIILVGTMWPVISLLWTPEPHGLDANFYNRVCVPLGMLIMLLLMVPTMVIVHIRSKQLERAIEWVATLPLTIPAIVLVVGLGPIYRWLSADVLSTNPIWLCFAYVILVMPFAFRALAVGLNSIDVKTLCEASRSLGASWPRVFFRVLIPNLWQSILSASFISIAVVLGEYTVASLLGRMNLQVALYQLGQSNSQISTAMSLLALLFGVILLVALDLISDALRKSKESNES